MSEHVLVVGPGRDFPSRLRAAQPGTRTTVICQVDYLHKIREPAECVRVIGVAPDAPDEEWVELAAAAHKRDPFTRIGSFGERNQDRYAAIGAGLGLFAHSPDTVRLVHDKAAMRERLRAAGLDTTACGRVSSAVDLRTFVEQLDRRCVVKPISSSGSAGVTQVGPESDLDHAFVRASGGYLGLGSTGVLVEEFIPGAQFSVEAFSEAGEHEIVTVTRKYSDPSSFVELGHVAPAGLAPQERATVVQFVGHVLAALGIEFGPTHTEVILGPAGPRLIETHVRMGGDQIPQLALDATGVDIDDCTARQTLGDTVLPGIRTTLTGQREARSAAIWFASLSGTGLLQDVAGVESANAIPGVTEVGVLARIGAEVGGLETSESRVAFARATAETADAAVATAQEAVALLDFGLRARSQVIDTV